MSRTVGYWNIERLSEFPPRSPHTEFNNARTDEDYRELAETISNMGVDLLWVEEVDAVRQETGAGGAPVFEQHLLDRLKTEIRELNEDGRTFGFRIGTPVITAGGLEDYYSAVLFDPECIELLAVCRGQPQRLPGRHPLRAPFVARVALTSGSQTFNDLLIIGVHLGTMGEQSGEQSPGDCDCTTPGEGGRPSCCNGAWFDFERAITDLRSQVNDMSSRGVVSEVDGSTVCIPSDERDVAILGTFNADPRRNAQPEMWANLDASGYELIAFSSPDPNDWEETLIEGDEPAALARTKAVDFFAVSRFQPELRIEWMGSVPASSRGLWGDEINDPAVAVTEPLSRIGETAFRTRLSDHLPIKVRIEMRCDDDVEPCRAPD